MARGTVKMGKILGPVSVRALLVGAPAENAGLLDGTPDASHGPIQQPGYGTNCRVSVDCHVICDETKYSTWLVAVHIFRGIGGKWPDKDDKFTSTSLYQGHVGLFIPDDQLF